jgi:hypothetical protein
MDATTLILLTIIAVFLIGRELVAWYFKINKKIAQNDEIIRLLKKLAGEYDESN